MPAATTTPTGAATAKSPPWAWLLTVVLVLGLIPVMDAAMALGIVLVGSTGAARSGLALSDIVQSPADVLFEIGVFLPYVFGAFMVGAGIIAVGLSAARTVDRIRVSTIVNAALVSGLFAACAVILLSIWFLGMPPQ